MGFISVTWLDCLWLAQVKLPKKTTKPKTTKYFVQFWAQFHAPHPIIQMYWLEMVTLPLHSCHAPSFTLASTGEELICAEVFLSQVSTGLSLAKLLGTNIQVLSIWLDLYCNYCRSMARHKEIHRVVTEILPLPTLPMGEVAGAAKRRGTNILSWLRASPCPGHASLSVWCLATEHLNAEFPVQTIASGKKKTVQNSGQY